MFNDSFGFRDFRHREQRHGEMKICHICGKGCYKASQLKQHLYSHHKVKDPSLKVSLSFFSSSLFYLSVILVIRLQLLQYTFVWNTRNGFAPFCWRCMVLLHCCVKCWSVFCFIMYHFWINKYVVIFKCFAAPGILCLEQLGELPAF